MRILCYIDTAHLDKPLLFVGIVNLNEPVKNEMKNFQLQTVMLHVNDHVDKSIFLRRCWDLIIK